MGLDSDNRVAFPGEDAGHNLNGPLQDDSSHLSEISIFSGNYAYLNWEYNQHANHEEGYQSYKQIDFHWGENLYPKQLKLVRRFHNETPDNSIADNLLPGLAAL